MIEFRDIQLGANARDAARSRILAALRRDGPLARVEISRAVGLSPASVSALTAALIAEGILAEEPEPDRDGTPRGRPRVRLGFSPDLGAIIGLWVGLDTIALTLADTAGRTIASRRENLALHRLAAPALIERLVERIADFRSAEAGGRQVHGLGVAFQGFVDADAGAVVWSPVLSCRDVPVVAEISRLAGLPVDLENDASAMALAIARHQPSLNNGRTASLMVGDGVGLGLLFDGQLYRGTRSGSSEFGHVRLTPGGAQCRCGGRGCIEASIADYALYRDAQAICDLPPPSGGRVPNERDMQAVVDLAFGGDVGLKTLFEATGRSLAAAVGILVQLLEPDQVVICGPGMRARALIEAGFEEGIKLATIPELRGLTRIQFADPNPDLLTEGVVIRALERLDRSLAAGLSIRA